MTPLVPLRGKPLDLGEANRIGRAVQHDDPAQAIGSAKELIESTAKLVNRELGHDITGREELPELVKTTQEFLLIHPVQMTTDGTDGSRPVKRILGAASTVATDIAEVRNSLAPVDNMATFQLHQWG